MTTTTPGTRGWAALARVRPEGRSVLIVDDEERIRTSLQKLAVSFGYSVRLADSAEEADQLLNTESFDVVLLDIELPRMNGVELLEWALQRDPELAVIMITGLDDPALAVQCMDAGARNYLVKPVNAEFLRIALRDAVEMGRLLKAYNRSIPGG